MTTASGRLIRPTFVTREMLRDQSSTLFAFGDNMQRRGRGGRARARRGEPNAIGIPTKLAPSLEPAAFFSDTDWDRQDVRDAINGAFMQLADAIGRGRTVAIPADGLGTGRAELPSRAPRIAQAITARIARLETLAAANLPNTRTTRPRVLNKNTDLIPPGAIYCGRPSPLGNPFVIGQHGSRDQVCDKYEGWLPTQPKLVAMIPSLAGLDLVCFCAPRRCHCHFLLRLANPGMACT